MIHGRLNNPDRQGLCSSLPLTVRQASLTPTLETGPFFPEMPLFHAATMWQVATAADLTSGMVVDSASMTQLTSFAVPPGGLAPGTGITGVCGSLIQVRCSEWSDTWPRPEGLRGRRRRRLFCRLLHRRDPAAPSAADAGDAEKVEAGIFCPEGMADGFCRSFRGRRASRGGLLRPDFKGLVNEEYEKIYRYTEYVISMDRTGF